MKAQLREATYNFKQTLLDVRNHLIQGDNTPHYHNELEVIYIKTGSASLFVGDSVVQLKPGDIVLLGSFLAHYLKFDSLRADQTPEVTVLHFKENLLGENFLDLPENRRLKELLSDAKRGVKVNTELISKLIEMSAETAGIEKMILLLEILSKFMQSPYSLLSNTISSPQLVGQKNQIDAIYNYSMENFKENITMEQLADIANVSPRSFCRFFKSKTKKTYTQFLNEIKVNQACRLLIENNHNIKQVCFESGFNNFVSFHKHFKSITGRSPLQYQSEILSPHKDCA